MKARQKRERRVLSAGEPAAGPHPCLDVYEDRSLAPEHQFFGKKALWISPLRSVAALFQPLKEEHAIPRHCYRAGH